MAKWGKGSVAKLYGGAIHFRLSDPGTDEWIRALEGVKRRALDLQPFFDRFGTYLIQSSIPMNFAAGGRPRRWARLSPRYAARKAKRWGKRPILVASGAMQQGFAYRASKRTLHIKNPRDYWQRHQHGGGHLPQRIIVLLQSQDKAVASKMLKSYLYESLEGL